MNYYIRSYSVDPAFNLALEQYVFDEMDRADSYMMLWQNDNTIVVGKHQNTFGEVNQEYVDSHNVHVVRRLSGGGAVYHDLGNINFTFITDHFGEEEFDFSEFCKVISEALATMGVKSDVNGRNDITIDGKKFSGNSQYMRENRIMHHGTIMYDSNLDIVEKALAVPEDKLKSKGLKSIKSRVTNVKPYIETEMSTEDFFHNLETYLCRELCIREYHLSEYDRKRIEEIKKERYDKWEWNYGHSPQYSICKKRRVEGCGMVEVRMSVEKGIIRDIGFYGDYFGNGDEKELARQLIGASLTVKSLEEVLQKTKISHYFNKLTKEEFINILLH